jgi:CheY-like chemotaxis protein
VVDDSADAADTTATLLESAGCAVRAAYSGEEALREVEAFRPEIVLLDIGMPGLDGLEACSRIRSLPGGGSLFLVALTGWGQDEDRRKTREAGFDAHLVKPVAPDALLNMVEQGRTKDTSRSNGDL